MPLPVLDDAINHLRVAPGFDDEKVQSCLSAATGLALAFLDREIDYGQSSSSSEPLAEIPAAVNDAILMITEALYDGRAAGQGDILREYSTEWMLLFPYRRVGV